MHFRTNSFLNFYSKCEKFLTKLKMKIFNVKNGMLQYGIKALVRQIRRNTCMNQNSNEDPIIFTKCFEKESYNRRVGQETWTRYLVMFFFYYCLGIRSTDLWPNLGFTGRCVVYSQPELEQESDSKSTHTWYICWIWILWYVNY